MLGQIISGAGRLAQVAGPALQKASPYIITGFTGVDAIQRLQSGEDPVRALSSASLGMAGAIKGGNMAGNFASKRLANIGIKQGTTGNWWGSFLADNAGDFVGYGIGTTAAGLLNDMRPNRGYRLQGDQLGRSSSETVQDILKRSGSFY